ncbi:MAG TPA: WYL domain-containing protein [Syntrophomonadaceae bacterium]|nr:WYL domain-containing protein [Syntrophomonadaceae bacterium]
MASKIQTEQEKELTAAIKNYLIKQPDCSEEEILQHLHISRELLYSCLNNLQGDSQVCEHNSFLVWKEDGRRLTIDDVRQGLSGYKNRKKSPHNKERLLYLYTTLHQAIPDGGLSFERIQSMYRSLIDDYGGEQPKNNTLKRMIYRDLNDLEQMGIGIERPSTGSERYCLKEYYLPKLPPEEASTLYTSMLLYRGTLLDHPIEATRQELERAFFRNIPERSRRLQERVYVVGNTLADPRQFEDYLGLIIRALTEEFRIKIDYRNNQGEESRRLLEPVGLVYKRSVWYLIGRQPENSAFRTFRVDQIRGITPRERDIFEYPQDFDLREHIGSSWGVFCNDPVQRVRLHFSPRVAMRVKNLRYHHSQRLVAELEDGSVVMEFEVCGLIEMHSWILQWGNQVEVLEPMELREQIQKAARDILAVYK